MATERNYWVLCDDNCKFPAMTAEQITTAIANATGNTGNIDVDSAFITKIKEMNASNNLQFWVGTTAQYNAITEKAQNTLYLLTDDNGADYDGIINELTTGLENLANSVATNTSEITKIKNGTTKVPKATQSDSATNATNTDFTNATWERADAVYFHPGCTYEVFFEQTGTISMGYYFTFSIPSGVSPYMIAFSMNAINEEVAFFLTKSSETNVSYYIDTSSMSIQFSNMYVRRIR